MKLLTELLVAVSSLRAFNERNDHLEKVAWSRDVLTSAQDSLLGPWLTADAEPQSFHVGSLSLSMHTLFWCI